MIFFPFSLQRGIWTTATGRFSGASGRPQRGASAGHLDDRNGEIQRGIWTTATGRFSGTSQQTPQLILYDRHGVPVDMRGGCCFDGTTTCCKGSAWKQLVKQYQATHSVWNPIKNLIFRGGSIIINTNTIWSASINTYFTMEKYLLIPY